MGTRESKELDVKKKAKVMVLKVQFKDDFSYFIWEGSILIFK